MPAEWEPHEATWLAWPHNPEDWPGKFQPIPWVYAEIVRLLAARERVHIVVEDAKAEQRARGILKRAGANLERVSFHPWPTDRGVDARLGADLCSQRPGRSGRSRIGASMAWAKYDDWQLDDQVPGRVAELLGLPQWEPAVEVDGEARRVVLEGGSIDTNGQGILLTTEECLLSEVQQRNPGVSREQMEQVFHDFLGIDQVIWLGRGMAGDDTHGHVDDITRFVGPETIVTAVEPDTKRCESCAAGGESAAAEGGAHARMASSSRLSNCRCRGRWFFAGRGCRRAMRISILRMGWCWCPRFTIPTTAWR